LFPISLLGLVATGAVFLLQVIPEIGVVLMVVLAMFWPIVLINASMIGVAIEAIGGRVSRLWLLLPVIFYGGYWIAATLDRLALREIASQYEVSNARVVTGFDPVHQALVFEADGVGGWLTANFALPVSYNVDPSLPEEYRSNRMVESTVCAKLNGSNALRAAFVYGSAILDGDTIGRRSLDKRFCGLTMPEKPELPQVVVRRTETKGFEKSLPITRVLTTITMPDGRRFELFGGVAAPLFWIPRPIMGCALNSGAPSWNCTAGFMRKTFTPIVSGKTRYGRDSMVLANALGLRSIAVEDRVGSDSEFVLRRLAEIEEAAAKASP
jgi:hypothetical protein